MVINKNKYQEYIGLVNSNGLFLDKVPIEYRTEEMCLAAVKETGISIKYVNSQTTEICMIAVKQYPESLRFVINQSPEICMEAVKNNGMALRYIKNQTSELCMAAVKKNGMSLEYVNNQTPELCMEAIKKNALAIYKVRDLKSIALLVEDDFIDKEIDNFVARKAYTELKELKEKMLATNLALASIKQEEINVRRVRTTL